MDSFQMYEPVDDDLYDPPSFYIQSESVSHSSILQASFNFANSIVGAGIIGLPYAFKQSGVCLGIFLLLFVACLVAHTVVLLIHNGRLSGKNTYQGLVMHCYGQNGLLIISVFQFIFAYGAMCAYTVILGDSFPSVFNSILPETSLFHPLLTSRAFIILACTLCISLPLSMYRDVSALSKASAISLGMIVFIVLAVCWNVLYLTPDQLGDPALRWTVVDTGLFEAIGVISFAFVCHHNTYLIYGSLKNPTIQRFTMVTNLSILVSFILCLILAFVGYQSFTNNTSANILNNFDKTNFSMNIARVFFGMNMFLTFPMECFVCREVLFHYFLEHLYPPKTDLTKAVSTTMHSSVTIVLVLSAMVIALSTEDLGFMLELTGGFAATVLAYILPASCYIKLAPGSVFSMQKIPYLLIILFGIVVMVLSTFFSIVKFINKTN
ncbi:transmembrane amino acid transporter protein-domain-containing protein [Globomyces pollinis-pini]|nr:transmembrane amino acid transporter protein-domain-containing protein [Globomyces pollinis-pini]